MTAAHVVTWEDDPDADRSYLEQPCYADVDPDTIVSFQMTAHDQLGQVVDSLGGVDLLDTDPHWTGAIYSVEHLDNLVAAGAVMPYVAGLTREAFGAPPRILAVSHQGDGRTWLTSESSCWMDPAETRSPEELAALHGLPLTPWNPGGN